MALCKAGEKTVTILTSFRSGVLVLAYCICCAAFAFSQTTQGYQASIGKGFYTQTGPLYTDSCGVPSYSVNTEYGYWGTLTLLPGLMLNKDNDGTWQAATLTAFGPTSLGLGDGYQAGITGGSNYTSEITTAGILTTFEEGATSGSGETYSVSSKEIIDLNPGRYTWHRVITGIGRASCRERV